MWVSLAKATTEPGVIRIATSVDSTSPYQAESTRLEVRALTGAEADPPILGCREAVLQMAARAAGAFVRARA